MERGRDRGKDHGKDRGKKKRRRAFPRRKVCRFCADKKARVDYRDPNTLKFFVTERGKIIPRRISGNCAYHQRKVAKAIKQARQIALLPYASSTV